MRWTATTEMKAENKHNEARVWDFDKKKMKQEKNTTTGSADLCWEKLFKIKSYLNVMYESGWSPSSRLCSIYNHSRSSFVSRGPRVLLLRGNVSVFCCWLQIQFGREIEWRARSSSLLLLPFCIKGGGAATDARSGKRDDRQPTRFDARRNEIKLWWLGARFMKISICH